MTWGTLKWTLPNGKAGQYQITDEDALWGCRMIIGEGADDALEVLQCMAQRFVHVGAWESLDELYRAYSQPINPIWTRTGKRCAGRVGESGCEEHRLVRRDRLIAASIEELRREEPASMSGRGIDDALAWFRGDITTDATPGCVHFAIKSLVVKNNGGGDPRSPLIRHKGRNWFAAIEKTASWPLDAVRVFAASGHGATFIARSKTSNLASAPIVIPPSVKKGLAMGGGVALVVALKKLFEWWGG